MGILSKINYNNVLIVNIFIVKVTTDVWPPPVVSTTHHTL